MKNLIKPIAVLMMIFPFISEYLTQMYGSRYDYIDMVFVQYTLNNTVQISFLLGLIILIFYKK